jgi:hypothetical protein
MKQVKIYAEEESAEKFKSLCAKNGTSITAELSSYMRKRTQLKEPATEGGSRIEKRWQRKAAVRRIVSLLLKIRDAEGSYLESIPENLRSGPMAEAADEAVGRLDEAISALEETYAV